MMATGAIGQPLYLIPIQNPIVSADTGTGPPSGVLNPPSPGAPTDHDLLMELVQRYEVLGNAVVKLSERIADPSRAVVTQGAPAAAGPSGADIIGRIIDLAGKALGGESSSSSLFQELYVKAHENYDARVLLPTFSNLARGEIRHVASHVG